MANARSNNIWYVDTGDGSGNAYLSERQVKVVGILFYVNATTDIITISDKLTGSDAAGATKLSLMSATAKNITQINLDNSPLTFPNGLAINLSGSPKITFILSQAG